MPTKKIWWPNSQDQLVKNRISNNPVITPLTWTTADFQSFCQLVGTWIHLSEEALLVTSLVPCLFPFFLGKICLLLEVTYIILGSFHQRGENLFVDKCLSIQISLTEEFIGPGRSLDLKKVGFFTCWFSELGYIYIYSPFYPLLLLKLQKWKLNYWSETNKCFTEIHMK